MCEILHSPTLNFSQSPLWSSPLSNTSAYLRNALTMPSSNNIPTKASLAGVKERGQTSPVAIRRRTSSPAANSSSSPTTSSSSSSSSSSPSNSPTPSCCMAGLLKYSGKISMEAPGTKKTKVDVVLSVYNSPFDTYAVISQDRIMLKDCGYINLKNCCVERGVSGGCSFQLAPMDSERPPLVFHTPSEEELTVWMRTIEQCVQKEDTFEEDVVYRKRRAFGKAKVSPRPLSGHHNRLLSLSALEEEEDEE